MYMYEVVKCPNHGGSESLRMLRHYREPMSEPSPRNINYYNKIGEDCVVAARSVHNWPERTTTDCSAQP